MSANVALFTFNDSTKELEINRLEATKIAEYAELFKRDKYSPSDPTGRKKFIACAEIYYIYLVHDIRSPYYNHSLSERKEKARKDAKLPDKWKEDDVLQKAVDRYLEDFNLSSTGSAYSVAEKAYYTITRDTANMQEMLIGIKELLLSKYAKLEKGKDKVQDLESATLSKEVLALIDNAASVQKKIIDNIKTFEDLGKKVKQLGAAYIEEGGAIKIPVGGGELGNREE